MILAQLRSAVFYCGLLLVTGSATVHSAAPRTPEQLLTEAAIEQRLVLEYGGGAFSGPAWERLVEAGANAQFFLLGEEHGIAENAKFAGRLFTALAPHGYARLAIEVSPGMATALDRALAADGLRGLQALFAQPGAEPAFFGMAEEAQMLAAIDARRNKTGLLSRSIDYELWGVEPLLWGTDYEVLAERHLISLLRGVEKPPAAERALDAVADAADASWDKYEETRSAEFIFSFDGDPALLSDLRAAWPDPDPESAVMINTLARTLAINQLWKDGRAWESNRARADLQRENFLRYWREEKRLGRAPRVMAKYGASHMVRGLSQTGVYDLGTLLPELAALEGLHSVSLLVLPGSGSEVAVINPASWRYEPGPPKDSYKKGLAPLLNAALKDKFTLIDLTALRTLSGHHRQHLDDELVRVVYGFDMLLVMSGSTPSTQLEPWSAVGRNVDARNATLSESQ